MISRRVFSLLTLVPIATYAEPLALFSDQGDWIEDRGDFTILRIPDRKTFADEIFLKPLIVIMGVGSKFRDCEVKAVSNFACTEQCEISHSIFDGSEMLTQEKRPLLLVSGNGCASFHHLIATGGASNDCLIYVSAEGSKLSASIVDSTFVQKEVVSLPKQISYNKVRRQK